MNGFVARTRKASVAGVGAALAAFFVAIKDGDFTGGDLAMVVGSFAVVWFGTFLVPNRPAPVVATSPYGPLGSGRYEVNPHGRLRPVDEGRER